MKKNTCVRSRILLALILVAVFLAGFYGHSIYDQHQFKEAVHQQAIANRVSQLSTSNVTVVDCIVIEKYSDGTAVGYFDKVLYELYNGNFDNANKNPIAIDTAVQKLANENGCTAILIHGNKNQLQVNPFLTYDLKRK